MKRFIRSRVTSVSLLLAFSYWVFFWVVPLPLLMTTIVAMIIALWAGIIASYAKGTWLAIRDPTQRLSTRVSLVGITGLGLSLIALSLWGYAYQYMDQPPWMRVNPIRNWINWLFLCSTFGIWIAVAMLGERGFLPEGHVKRPSIIVAVAIFLVLVIVATIGAYN